MVIIRYISIGVYIKPEQWNDKLKMVVNHERIIEINTMLKNMINDLVNNELKIINNGRENSRSLFN